MLAGRASDSGRRMSADNVYYYTNWAARPTLMSAAEASLNSLKAIGIEAHMDGNNSSQNNDAIHFLVGPSGRIPHLRNSSGSFATVAATLG